jgi:hypothetical protein
MKYQPVEIDTAKEESEFKEWLIGVSSREVTARNAWMSRALLAEMELNLIRERYVRCMASRDALRDWAQECRDALLYGLAQNDNDIGRKSDGLGQMLAGIMDSSK